MKKLFKSVLVFAILATVCVALAGCGDKDDKKKDKKDGASSIVASKYFEAGNYNETIEAVLDEDGYATKFIITMEMDDEEKVEDMKSLVESSFGLDEAEVKVEGKKIIIEMSADEFINEENLEYEDNKVSKDDIKKLFEDNGFTVSE